MGTLKETFATHDQLEVLEKLEPPEILALQLACRYLDKMMLSEATVPFFEFQKYDEHYVGERGNLPLMNAATLANLDIFETLD